MKANYELQSNENDKKINELKKQIHTANEEVAATSLQKDELINEIKILRTNIIAIQEDFDSSIANLVREINNALVRLEELNKEAEMLYKSNSEYNKKLLLMRRKRFELVKEKNEEREKMEQLIREKEAVIRKLTIAKDLGIKMSGLDVGEATHEINVLREEIAVLREKEERGNYELVEPTAKNKIKAIFKRYGFTAAAIFSSVGVVISIIVSSITPGLSKTNRILSNGLKNVEAELKKLAERSPNNPPGILRMITEFIATAAGEALGFLGDNTWLLIFLVVVIYISN